MNSKQQTLAGEAPGAGRQGRAGLHWFVLVALAYAALGAYLAAISVDRLNPDGVGYILNARHWAAGRCDLAVNGWFGPMLSWLLVPVCWLSSANGAPAAAIRVLNVIEGLAFAMGAVALNRRFNSRRWDLFVFAAALVLGASTITAEITPDFLLAVVLTWYFAYSVDFIRQPSPKTGLILGVLGGAGYLVKAYALPFVAIHLAMTLLLRWWMRRKNLVTGGSVKGAAAAGAAMAVLCIPWIIAISVQYGQPTISSTSIGRRSWGPINLPTRNGLSHPIWNLMLPREGRLNNWENPIEISRNKADWYYWSPTEGMDKVKMQLEVIGLNVVKAVEQLRKADGLSLLLIGWAIALVSGFRLSKSTLRFWACMSVFIYIGGYLTLFFYERFVWAVWGIMLVLCVNLLDWAVQFAARRESGNEQEPGKPRKLGAKSPSPAAAGGPWKTVVAVAGMVLLAGSLGYKLYSKMEDDRKPAGDIVRCPFIRQAAEKFKLSGCIASNDWAGGLYAAYWDWPQCKYLGMTGLTRPYTDAAGYVAVVTDELQQVNPGAPTRVLILYDRARAGALLQSGRFRLVDSYVQGDLLAALLEPVGH